MAKKNANNGARKPQNAAGGKKQDRPDASGASSAGRLGEADKASETKEERNMASASSASGAKNGGSANASGENRNSSFGQSGEFNSAANSQTNQQGVQSDSGLSSNSNAGTGSKATKKDVAKAYEKYAGQFTPKPKYFLNSLKAFITGGLICVVSLWIENKFIASGMPEKEAAVSVVIILVMLAQFLTGLGWFDTIGKHVGAGVIVPITGFANSMVAPAIEYKKEGIILGVGAKLFSLAGPVLVSGITASLIIGVVYWAIGVIQ